MEISGYGKEKKAAGGVGSFNSARFYTPSYPEGSFIIYKPTIPSSP